MHNHLRPNESPHGAFFEEEGSASEREAIVNQEVEVTRGGLVTKGARVTETMGSLSLSSALYGIKSERDEYLEGLFTVSKIDIVDDGAGV